MTTTDLGEMVTMAVYAKNSGFEQVSVDADHVLEIGVMVGKLVALVEDASKLHPSDWESIKNDAIELLEELGE